MDIPDSLMSDLRDILLSKPGGVFLHELCGVFQRQTKKVLNIHHLGFPTLEAFINAIPNVARMEYSAPDKCVRVLGIKPVNFQGRKETKNNNNRVEKMDHDGVHGAGILGLPGHIASGRPGLLPVGHCGKADAQNNHPPAQPSYMPDNRGVFFVCFPAENRPHLEHDNLKNHFGLAGNVSAVNETPKWIYVGYNDPQAVTRALKMFSHLGMTVFKPAPIEEPSQKSAGIAEPKLVDSNCISQQVERPKYRTPVEREKRLRDRKRRLSKLNNSVKIYVGNLDPAVKYTFDMFRNLFKDFRLEWVSLKPVNKVDDIRLYAFVLVSTLEKAMQLCKEYNGYVWMGRTLEVNIKEKRAKITASHENSIDRDWNDTATESSLPELTELDPDDLNDMPGLEPLMPGLEPGMPGLEPCMPGLEPGMPGLEPRMPGLEPSMPGLEPRMPGLEPRMPGLEPTMPGLEPVMPGLEPLLAGSQVTPGKSDNNPKRMPDSMSPSVSCDIPTIIVANFRDGTTEDEVMNLFQAYGARSVSLVTTFYGKLKAFVRLSSVDDVKRAVDEVNQTPFKGLKILVDVPYNMPALREAVLGIRVDEFQPTAGGGVILSEILRMRGTCLQILQCPEITLNLGQQVKVLITTVISDKFFWGQIIDVQAFDQLRKVSEKLNQPDNRQEPATGPGRCSAIFQGDGKWYRAWMMHTVKSDLVRVFYVDYGNTAAIPVSHTNKIAPRWIWDLQPMAIPFAVTEPVTNLKSRELTQILVEVNALGGLEDGNMVVVRATSLVPNLLESVSSIGQTVIL